MKKGEAWVNTFTPVLTYLSRCNTDVTSLLSGTAMRAVSVVDRLELRTSDSFDVVDGWIETRGLPGDDLNALARRVDALDLAMRRARTAGIGATSAGLYLGFT